MEHYWEKPHKEITKRLDRPRTVFYSVDADMNEVAIEGKVVMVEPADEFWAGEGAEDYRSAVMENPTWLDIALAADDMIHTVKDFHHVFIEGVFRTGNEDDVEVYRFTMGS